MTVIHEFRRQTMLKGLGFQQTLPRRRRGATRVPGACPHLQGALANVSYVDPACAHQDKRARNASGQRVRQRSVADELGSRERERFPCGLANGAARARLRAASHWPPPASPSHAARHPLQTPQLADGSVRRCSTGRLTRSRGKLPRRAHQRATAKRRRPGNFGAR